MPTRYTIERVVKIEAAHVLKRMPADHPCARLHGHSYRITVVMSARNLDQHGLILDPGIIAAYVKQFDMQNLNEFFEPSTAECFCMYLRDGLAKDVLRPINRTAEAKDWVRLESITVRETEDCTVTLTVER